MNTYEFLTQSPKQIGEQLKNAGILKYRELPTSKKLLNEALGLTDDSRIEHYHTITRGGSTEWYYHLDIGFESNTLDMELNVSGKCSVKYIQVGGYHTWVEIYEKVCPLFDKRPQYHNLKMRIDGKQYTTYKKADWKDEMIPTFDNNKPLSEYIDTIKKTAEELKPFIIKAEKACFDGEYIKAYDRYHFNPFKPGDQIFCDGPGFNSCVYGMYNAKKFFDIEISIDDVHAIYAHMMKGLREIQEYWKDRSGNGIRTLLVSLYDFFHYDFKNDISEEKFHETIQKARAGRIDRNKESWDSVYLSANREFSQSLKKLEKEIADKYQIPADYINIFNYDDDTDTCRVVPMPKELADRFGE